MLAGPAVLVAVVAGRGTVHEIRNAVVLIDGYRFLVSARCVAVDTGESRIIGRDLVAIVANGAVMRNREVRVLVAGAEPACCRVAAIASGSKSSGDVIRHGTAESLRAVPLRQVAAIASCIRCRERIVVVDVAVGAGLDAARRGHDVPSRQRPSRRTVIELAIGPGNRVVAGGAHRNREHRGHVIGNGAADRGGTVPIRDVAAGVVAIRDGEAVIVADVALIAVGDQTRGRHPVVAGQSPTGRSVIP